MVNERGPEAHVEVPLPHAGAPSDPPRLLTNRPFLWLVLADGTAGLGRWALFLAVVGDATFRLQATPGQVALVLASFSLPYILVSPLHGALADRWSAKWLFTLTTAGSAAAATIPLRTDSLASLYVAAALFGALNAAEIPSRGALIPRLVPAERLVQANGMVSAALAVQLIIGPTLAAVLVRFLGPDAPYLVTVGAAGAGAMLALLVPDRRAGGAPGGSAFGNVVAGFREGWGTEELRRLFLLAVAVWFLIGVLISLEPAYLREELGRGQVFLGAVWAVYGAGEVLGSIALARVRRGTGREPTLVALGLLLAAAGFLIYVSVRSPVAVIVGNVVFGVGFPFFTATSQALIQRLARFPGQVSAAFSMAGEGGPVAAAALLGSVGQRVGIRTWLLLSGAVFTLVALVALSMARRRPVVAE
jgi:predicted MFS family arabinose efflux permease